MTLRIVILCAFLFALISIANAGSLSFQTDASLSIPTNVQKKPAADLLGPNGTPLDPGQAAQLSQKGQDLSLLNPKENLFWQNQSYSASDADERVYPVGAKGVKFLSFEAEIPSAFTTMFRVQSSEDPNVYYRMSISRYSHTALMRAALLRKLGFYLPSPKYYRDLKVIFSDEEEKQIFLDSVQSTMTTDFESRGWIIKNDVVEHSLVLADSLLEPAQEEYFDIQWGFAPNPDDPDQLPLVQRYSKFRAYRSLILPFTLVDVPESINRYSAKIGSILSGFVVLTHPAANSFSAAGIEDIQWLLRRLGELKFQDYKEIVDAGKFPEELAPLVLAKLLHRSNNAFELFNISPKLPLTLPSLDISTPSGLVLNGKVTQELVPGYPIRFAHGERESPFKDGDIWRYLSIRGKTAFLATAFSQINKKLELLGSEQILNDRRQSIQQSVVDHFKKNPRSPYVQNVEGWGGFLAGLNVAASRTVATGTYFGSTAAIQLVDNMAVSVGLGYVATLDGVSKVTPMAGANLNFQRDFTHVRPILSIEEGTKVEWKDLVIPHFMKNISEVLKSTELIPGKNPEDPKQNPLDAFLTDLRDGEVFTITDSVTMGAYAKLSAGLDVLMGFSPLNFLNMVSLGADGTRVTLQQTSFLKTPSGVQVFVRKQNSNILGATLDVNYFINLLKIRAQSQNTEIKTDAFVIDYNPAEGAFYQQVDPENVPEDAQKFFDRQRKLRLSLLSLFKSNDTEILYESFPFNKFEVDHKLQTKETRAKILFLRSQKFEENHWLQIKYPAVEGQPELNPEDEKVVLYRRKRGELQGRDLLGFGTELLEGYINSKSETPISLGGSSDPNPANMPFGKAFWRMTTTEGDISPQGQQMPTVAILQHVWGGWKLPVEKFFKLVDEISKPFEGTGLMSYRLIEKEAFINLKSVDFYRITQQLSILPGGVEAIRDLILQPQAQGKVPKAKFLARLFQKLSEKIGGTKAKASDKEMFNAIMKILGNGDLKTGQAAFNKECRTNQAPGQGGGVPSSAPGYWLNGTYYECLLPWVSQLLILSSKFPTEKEAQIRWVSDVLFILDQQIPMPQLLKYLDPKNYIFFVRINGFRTGDEDGDLEYFSNSAGDPSENSEYANGLVNLFATKTRISPVELDRSQGAFR